VVARHDGPVEITLSEGPGGLTVKFGTEGEREFTWRWIKDHGEDPQSVDRETGQRLVDTFAIHPNLQASDARVEGANLVVEWADGAPATSVAIDTLAQASGVFTAPDERQLWTAVTAPDPVPVAFAELARSDETLGQALGHLLRDGFTVVDGLPNDLDSTRALIDRLGGVRNSVFGDIWSVVSGSGQHADSAYASIGLEPHTDGTYSYEGPGFQVLHFTQTGDSGGESELVDGMAVCQQLRELNPAYVKTLATVEVPARYVEPGVELVARRPALRFNHLGRFSQISFNNYDRTPLWLPPAEMDAFYEAYLALHELVMQPSNRFVRRLDEGEALIFDNWRLLHGRTAFTGERRFQGGYLNQEDVQSRRLTLGRAKAG